MSRAQLNYEKGNIKSIHYGDILIKYNSILEITKDKIPFITDGSIEKYKPNLLENGDVVFADAAEDETVGKAVEINGISDEYVVAGLHTIVARPKEKMAKYFSGYYINADVYQRQLLRLMQGTKVSSISKGNLKKTIVAYPKNLAEQQKIGSFFKQLDNAIALHQHHLDNHKELKKALLQKMFPRNGEKLPEVRFGGFTEVWEKRKLNKVMSDFIVPMRDKPKEFSGEIPWTRIEDIEGKYLNDSLSGQYVSQAIIEKMNLKVIPKDSLIVSASATFGVVAIVTQDLITNQTFIGLVPEANFDLDFLYTLFQTPTVRTKMKFESAGSTIFYITRQTFENMQFLLPSYEEQQSIGSFFKNIDDTITLLQQKLNDYQRLKKVMLQQMFV